MDNPNPYQNPKEHSTLESVWPFSDPKQCFRVANGTLWLVVFCIVMYMPLAASTVWVGLWRGRPLSYSAMDWACNGLAAVGLLACVVSGVLGDWQQRVTAVLLGVFCGALLSHAATSILRSLERLL
jgi:hypothetical protein